MRDMETTHTIINQQSHHRIRMLYLLAAVLTLLTIEAPPVRSQPFREIAEYRGSFGDTTVLLTLVQMGLGDSNQLIPEIGFVNKSLFDSSQTNKIAQARMKKLIHKMENKKDPTWPEAQIFSWGGISIKFSPSFGQKPSILIDGKFRNSYDTIFATIKIRNKPSQNIIFIRDPMTFEDRIRQFMRDFKNAIAEDNRKFVISVAGHAIVNVKKKKVSSIAEFEQKYNDIFNEGFKNRIRSFTIDDTLWEHNGSYEFGENGDFWIGVGGMFFEDLDIWVETINGNIY
jgi:hypothetical protein